MIYCVKGLTYIKKKNTNILLLVKCIVPCICTVEKKRLSRVTRAEARLVGVQEIICLKMISELFFYMSLQ